MPRHSMPSLRPSKHSAVEDASTALEMVDARYQEYLSESALPRGAYAILAGRYLIYHGRFYALR